jgi:hypothetical protein
MVWLAAVLWQMSAALNSQRSSLAAIVRISLITGGVTL